jgi:transposase
MLKYASSELSKFKPTALKKMGIDEIALVKGKGNYCAVLVDLEKSDLIAILERRTQSKIEIKLLSWGTEVLEQIEEVSIDMWKGYKSLV